MNLWHIKWGGEEWFVEANRLSAAIHLWRRAVNKINFKEDTANILEDDDDPDSVVLVLSGDETEPAVIQERDFPEEPK